MSYEAMEYAWRKDGLTGTEKIVLVSLADHANIDGDAIFPKVDRIVRRTSLSRSTVMDTRRRLEKGDLIERTGRKIRGVIEYRLTEFRGPADGHPAAKGSSSAAKGSSSAVERVREPDPEQQQNGQEQKEKDPPTPLTPARRVWDHYVEVMKPRHRDLDPEDHAIINRALKVASEQECKDAITGCSRSSHHMGENDRGRKYNRISHILKGKQGVKTTRDQIVMFLEIAEKVGLQSDVTSADRDKVREAKRCVRDSYEFPKDATVVERGEQAEAWLAEQGWAVDRDAAGMPSFRLLRRKA